MVKFVFSLSKLRKQPFLLKFFNIQGRTCHPPFAHEIMFFLFTIDQALKVLIKMKHRSRNEHITQAVTYLWFPAPGDKVCALPTQLVRGNVGAKSKFRIKGYWKLTLIPHVLQLFLDPYENFEWVWCRKIFVMALESLKQQDSLSFRNFFKCQPVDTLQLLYASC